MNSKSFFSIPRDVKIILAIGLFLRIIVACFLPAGYDEAYYWSYTQNPSLGYFDHPPMVSLTAALGLFLTPVNDLLALRFGSIIFFLMSSLVLYNITRRVTNLDIAKISVILFHTIPFMFIGIGIFVFPDNALILFWLLSIYFLVKIQKDKSISNFLLLGLSLGLASLSKYHSVLLYFCISILVLFFKDWRPLLKEKYFYLMLLVSFLVFLPNLYWNYNNQFITLIYQFGKSAENNQLNFTTFYQGIFAQAGYLFPWYFVIFIISFFKFRQLIDRRFWWLIVFISVPILIFTSIGLKRQILPHWPMPGYVTGIILLSTYMYRKQKLFNYTNYISAFLIILVFVTIYLNIKFFILPLNPDNDPSLDGYGWNELVEKLDNKNFITNSDFVFSHKWFISGQLAFAAKNKYQITCLQNDQKSGFDFWINKESLISRTGFFISPSKFNDSPVELYKNNFDSITKIDSFSIKHNNKIVKTFYIWKCTNYKMSTNDL